MPLCIIHVLDGNSCLTLYSYKAHVPNIRAYLLLSTPPPHQSHSKSEYLKSKQHKCPWYKKTKGPKLNIHNRLM